MTVSALIAARMGSSRFEGKSLADLHGRPMLERMIERIRRCDRIKSVVLATTDQPEDDALETFCEDIGISCFRGSADDVLGRLASAAEAYNLQTIVEMLGDNPLVHADMINAAIDRFEETEADYTATLTNEYPNAAAELKKFPIGVRVQVFSIDTLKRCENLAKSEGHREHATSFIADRPDIFKTTFVEAMGTFVDLNRPELTFAVNHRENLDLIRGLFARLYDDDANFTIADSIKAFDATADLHPLMGAQATD